MWCYLLHFRKTQTSWVTYSRSEPEFKPNILMILILTSLRTISLVQFSRSVVSNSLWSHGLQHTRPPCPSPAPRIYSNSRPLSQWCHPTISSSVIPSPPAFSLSQHQGLFKCCLTYQVAKVLEFQFQHQSFQWIFRVDFPLGWIGWISLQSKGLSRVLSNSLALSLLCGPTLTSIHDSWKNHSFDYTYLCWQNDVSVFNMLFRFVIAFLPRCTNAKEAELNGSMRTYKTF